MPALRFGRDLFGVQLGRGLIGNQNHDHVGPLSDVGDGVDFKAGLLRLGNGFGVGGKAYFHLNAGVLEVEGVGVALRAVADDGHFLGLNEGKVGVVIVVSLSHDDLDFPLRTGCEMFVAGLSLRPQECSRAAARPLTKLALAQLIGELLQARHAIN